MLGILPRGKNFPSHPQTFAEAATQLEVLNDAITPRAHGTPLMACSFPLLERVSEGAVRSPDEMGLSPLMVGTAPELHFSR